MLTLTPEEAALLREALRYETHRYTRNLARYGREEVYHLARARMGEAQAARTRIATAREAMARCEAMLARLNEERIP